jgi:cell division protein FtsL
MSVPARTISGDPAHDRAAHPARRPAARPLPSTPPQRSRGARRGFHPGFWIFSVAVVAALAIGIVAMHALLVQTEYAIRSTGSRTTQLQIEHENLVERVAALSSPSRVATWAHGHGMVTPINVVILRVGRGAGSTDATAAGARG